MKALTAPEVNHSGSFKYLQLPKELRLAILSNTDLVSSTLVQWRPRTEIYRIQSPTCTDYDHGKYACPGSGYCRGPCLYVLGPNIDESIEYPCCGACKPDDYSGICYCSAQSQRWSSSCTCDFHRHALFSVSRQVRQDALSVYYAHNQILVTPYNSPLMRLLDRCNSSWFSADIPSPPKLELDLYLSAIDRSALQHIRRLEWILPCSEPTYLSPNNTPIWFAYLDTILLMRNAMTVKALTLTINISEPKWYYCRREYNRPLSENAWDWYQIVVGPLRSLGEEGLKDFFVHLRQFGVDKMRRIRCEQSLERLVMGDEYDSGMRGKPVERMCRYFQEVLGY